jgi:hypothetical protein
LVGIQQIPWSTSADAIDVPRLTTELPLAHHRLLSVLPPSSLLSQPALSSVGLSDPVDNTGVDCQPEQEEVELSMVLKNSIEIHYPEVESTTENKNSVTDWYFPPPLSSFLLSPVVLLPNLSSFTLFSSTTTTATATATATATTATTTTTPVAATLSAVFIAPAPEENT